MIPSWSIRFAICLFLLSSFQILSLAQQSDQKPQVEYVFDDADRDFRKNLSTWQPGSEKYRITTFPSNGSRLNYSCNGERSYLTVKVSVPAIKLTPEGGPSKATIDLVPNSCFGEGQTFVAKAKDQILLSGKLTKITPYRVGFEGSYKDIVTAFRNPDTSFEINGNTVQLTDNQMSEIRFFLDEFELWLVRKLGFEVAKPFLTNSFPGVNIEYDKFENQTTGRTIVPLEEKNGTFMKSGVFFVPEYSKVRGTTNSPAKPVNLKFVFVNKSPLSMDLGLKLVVLADGDRVVFNQPAKNDVHTISPTGLGGFLSEKLTGKEFKGTFVYEVPPGAFQKIANSTSIELRLGDYTAKIDETQKDKLRYFASFVGSLKGLGGISQPKSEPKVMPNRKRTRS